MAAAFLVRGRTSCVCKPSVARPQLLPRAYGATSIMDDSLVVGSWRADLLPAAPQDQVKGDSSAATQVA